MNKSPTNVENLITDNLDIWTSAIKKRGSQGRGSNKKIDLYGINKLRELILELAVRGLLVPQDPNDEPASVLLEKLAAEKAQLIKDKKIKKQKPLPPISDEEKPFELPKGWEFARLGDLTLRLGSGSTPRGGKSAYVESGIPFLRSQNVWNDGLHLDDTAYIDEDTHKKMDHTKVLPNDVLLNITGASLGRSTIFPEALIEANVSQHVTIIRLIQSSLSQFVHLGIQSPIVQRLVWGRQVGMAIEGLSKKVLELFEFPIPPKAEQSRIVTKVDELMALCDQLEEQTENSLTAHQTLVENLLDTLTQAPDNTAFTSAWERIAQHFDILFTTEHSIDLLKQTILQLAVMGKLVPQDPNDEPASVLIEKIAAEKEQLIKDKKIKKQKPLPPISEDEKPFELPKNWEWCRIGEASIRTDYGLSNKSVAGGEGIPVLAMGHIQNGSVLLGGQKTVSDTVESLPELYLEDRDLLYNRTNSAELVGKTGIYKGDDNSYTFASYLIRIRALKSSKLPEFINLNMQTPNFRVSQIVPHLKQQCGQANVNGTIMKNMIIAIAPDSEISRIIKKVSLFMNLCEQLKSIICESKSTELHLADAMAEQALN